MRGIYIYNIYIIYIHRIYLSIYIYIYIPVYLESVWRQENSTQRNIFLIIFSLTVIPSIQVDRNTFHSGWQEYLPFSLTGIPSIQFERNTFHSVCKEMEIYFSQYNFATTFSINIDSSQPQVPNPGTTFHSIWNF